MAWYEQWFDTDEYELVYQDRDETEAETLVDLILEVTGVPEGSRILDVGCGRGRHAVEFALRGFDVTGLDLSAPSLEDARLRADRAGVELRLIEGDMRDPVPEAFDLVVNLFTAFGYFEAEEDHRRASAAMAGSVDREGWLVQDFLNAPQIRSSLVAADVRTARGWEIRQTRRIRDDRILKRIEFRRDGSSRSFEESVALLELDDFERLYKDAGMEIVDLRGGYDGRPYTPAAPRLITFARRA